MLRMITFQAAIFVIILCIYSRKRFNKTLKNLDKREYPLKELFLPPALLLLPAIKKNYNTVYDRSLFSQISQLKGLREADFYVIIHWANKLAYLLLGILLLGVFWTAAQNIDCILMVFSFLVLGALFMAPDYELKKKVRIRKEQIELEFPSFLYKLVLLLNAGLTLLGAWERAVSGKDRNSPLYKELNFVLMEIKGGKSEVQAYEDLARRCKSPEIIKFVTIIIQNTKKGSYELAAILRKQAQECWDSRKHYAKKLGEEASTKMLLPMMLMFIAILMIVAAPAIMAMKNM